MTSTSPGFDQLKQKVALAYRILYLEKIAIDDTLGHISARLPGQEISCVKPWGMGFDEVDSTGLLEMSLQGEKIGGGEGRLHSEMPLHNEIYRARPDVNCVIHIHPFYATLLSSVWQGRLPRINQQTQQFAGGIACYDSSALIRTSAQGQAVAASLGDLNTLLLRNHGIVTVAASVEQAVVLAVQLERAAHAHLTMATQPAGEVQEIPEEIALRWAEELFQLKHCAAKFEYWCRKLARAEKAGVLT